MMKKLLLFTFAVFGVCTAFLTLRAENPREFPEYRQTLEIRFENAESAKKAELRAVELPEGKKLAFSTRWDDSNPRHKKMSETLKANGFRGNFYLGKIVESYFGKDTGAELLKNNCAIGAHTMNHPDLGTLNPNRVFYECMSIRPILESKFNTCVTAFVLPFCSFRSKYFDHVPHMIGDVLVRCGFLGGPEYQPNIGDLYGTSSFSWTGSVLFDINDRNPNPERFKQAMVWTPKKAKNFKNGPHITLGVHSWQSDKGLEVLSSLLASRSGNPQWWYCTENDYLAYRYQFLHSAFKRRGVSGKEVTFDAVRIAAPDLGSNIGIWVTASEKIVSARLNGRNIPVKNNMIELPHNPARLVPGTIDFVELPDGKTVTGVKDPEVSIGATFDSSARKLQFGIFSKKELRDVVVTLRLPPVWKTRIIRRGIPVVKPDVKQVQTFFLGVNSDFPGAEEGDFRFDIQTDYTSGKSIRRLHAFLPVKRVFSPTSAPRDNAAGLVSVDEKFLTPDYLAAISDPKKELSVPSGVKKEWVASIADPRLMPIFVSFPRPKELKRWDPIKGATVVALQFNATDLSDMNLFVPGGRKGFKSIYLNGKKLETKGGRILFRPESGTNRVVIVFDGNNTCAMQISVSKTTDPHRFVSFQKMK